MAAMWPQMWLVVALVAAAQGQTIRQGPDDTAGLLYTVNQMNCTVDNLGTSDAVEWRLFNNGTTVGGLRLYISSDSSQTAPGYSIDTTSSTGAYNLIIQNTLPENAGTYRCSLLAAGTSVDGEFIGVEAPVCSNSAKSEMLAGTAVTLSCSDLYRGKTAPTLTWENEYGANVAGQTSSSTTGQVTATANITVVASMNDAPFVCWLNFSPSPPIYTDSCTTFFSVIFGVMNMTIDPQPENGEDTLYMKVGQTLNCSAAGNPEPRYDWYAPDGSILPDTQFLDITQDMVGKGTLAYNCKATNEYQGQSRTANATVFFIAENQTGNVNSAGMEGWAIALCVILPILFLAGIGVLVYFFVFKKKGKTCGGSKTPAPTSVNYNPGGTTQSSRIYTPVNQRDTTDHIASTRPPTSNQFVTQKPLTSQISTRDSLESTQNDGMTYHPGPGYTTHDSSGRGTPVTGMGGVQVLPNPVGNFNGSVKNSPSTYSAQRQFQQPNNLDSSMEAAPAYNKYGTHGSNPNLAGAPLMGGNLGRSNPDLAGAGAGLGQDPPNPLAQQYGRRVNGFYNQQPNIPPRQMAPDSTV